MLTSSSRTKSRRCMRACASDMRMMDSMWRTVMGMLPVAIDSRRSSPYNEAICCASARRDGRGEWADLILVDLLQLGEHVGLGVQNIFAQKVLRKDRSVRLRLKLWLLRKRCDDSRTEPVLDRRAGGAWCGF